ncbi:MAG TPA: peptidylprolyl isomerase [Ilumatobacteraceae bacterium]|nr:peptidylprolyl isomerase [Ilumatobacteraceae bacterium]
MNRRAAVVPILLLAGAATGCSTFSDNGAAARVGEHELSQDELGDLLADSVPATEPGSGSESGPDGNVELDADTARRLLTTWITTRILEIDLAAQGTSVSPQAIADATGALAAPDPEAWANVPVGLQNLQVEQRAFFDTWSALEVASPSDAELRSIYDAGVAASGILCGAHILVETAGAAQDIVDQLEGGADFAELAASDSIDSNSGPNGGNLPCAPTDAYEANVPELAEAFLAADFGVPVGPVPSEAGYHVIVLRPSDQVDPGELGAVYNELPLRFQRVASGVDIYVDPRFGSFDPSIGVRAIG